MKEEILHRKFKTLLPLFFVVASWMLSACDSEQESPEEIRNKIILETLEPTLVNGVSLPSWTNEPLFSKQMTVNDGGFACEAVQKYPLQQGVELVQKGFVNVNGKPESVSSVTLDSKSCGDQTTHVQTQHKLTINLGEKEGPHEVEIEFANCVITDKITGETEEICGPVLTAIKKVVNLDTTPPTQESADFQLDQDDNKLTIVVRAADNGSLKPEAVIAGVSTKLNPEGTATVTIDPTSIKLGGVQSKFCDEAGNCTTEDISHLANDTEPPFLSLQSANVDSGRLDVMVKLDDDGPPELLPLAEVAVSRGDQTIASSPVDNKGIATATLEEASDLSPITVRFCDAFQKCSELALADLFGDIKSPKIESVGKPVCSEGKCYFDVVISDDCQSLLSLNRINIDGEDFPFTPIEDADGNVKAIAHVIVDPQQPGKYSFTYISKDAFGQGTEGYVDVDYDPCPKNVMATIGDDGRTVTFNIPTNSNLKPSTVKLEGIQDRWPSWFFNSSLFSFLTKVEQQTGLQLNKDEIQLTIKASTGRGPLSVELVMDTVDGYRCSLNYRVNMPEMTDREKMPYNLALVLSVLTTGALLTHQSVKRIRRVMKLREEERRSYVKDLLVKSIVSGTFYGNAAPLIAGLPRKEQLGWRNAVNHAQMLIEADRYMTRSDFFKSFEKFGLLYKETPKDFIREKREELFEQWLTFLTRDISEIVGERNIRKLSTYEIFFVDFVYRLHEELMRHKWLQDRVSNSLRQQIREVFIVSCSNRGELIGRYERILRVKKQEKAMARELVSIVQTLSDWGDFQGATVFINEVKDRELQEKLNLQLKEVILKMKRDVFKIYLSTDRKQAGKFLNERLLEYRLPGDEEKNIRQVAARLDSYRVQINELKKRYKQRAKAKAIISQIEQTLLTHVIGSNTQEIDQRLDFLYLVLKLIDGEVKAADVCSDTRPLFELTTAFEILLEADRLDVADALVRQSSGRLDTRLLWRRVSELQAQFNTAVGRGDENGLIGAEDFIRQHPHLPVALSSEFGQRVEAMRQVLEEKRRKEERKRKYQETIAQFRQQFIQSPMAQAIVQQAEDLLRRDQIDAFSQQMAPLRITSDLLSAADFESKVKDVFRGRKEEGEIVCEVLLEVGCFDLLSFLIVNIPDEMQKIAFETKLNSILNHLKDNFEQALSHPEVDLAAMREEYLKMSLPRDLKDELVGRIEAEQERLLWFTKDPDSFLIPIVERGMREAKGKLPLVEAISAAVRAQAILYASHENVPYILGFNDYDKTVIDEDKTRPISFNEFLALLKRRLIFLLREFSRLSNASISPDIKTHLLVNTIHARAMQWLQQARDEEGIWPKVLERWLRADKPANIPVLITFDDKEEDYTLTLFDS